MAMVMMMIFVDHATAQYYPVRVSAQGADVAAEVSRHRCSAAGASATGMALSAGGLGVAGFRKAL